MKEPQWWMCGSPEGILQWLGPMADDRCLRLFACACCRLIWPIIPNGQCKRSVEASERYADGLIGCDALQAAEAAARSVSTLGTGGWLAAWAAGEAAGSDARAAAAWVPAWSAEAAGEAAARTALAAENAMPASFAASTAWRQQRQLQCAILRDIFASPIHPTAPIDPSCLLWQNGAVVKVAQASYDRGGSDDLSHLARLLEQAGCDDEDVLAHCRVASGHVRGCWVLDLLLGRRDVPGRARDFLRLQPGAQTPLVESRTQRGMRRIRPESAILVPA